MGGGGGAEHAIGRLDRAIAAARAAVSTPAAPGATPGSATDRDTDRGYIVELLGEFEAAVGGAAGAVSRALH